MSTKHTPGPWAAASSPAAGTRDPITPAAPVSIIRMRLDSARAAGDVIPDGPTVRGLRGEIRLGERAGRIAALSEGVAVLRQWIAELDLAVNDGRIPPVCYLRCPGCQCLLLKSDLTPAGGCPHCHPQKAKAD